MDKAKMKIVYTIQSRLERPADGGPASVAKKYWNRIGIAFENADGSLNVKLEALPVSGELHIRDYVPRQHQHPETAGRRKSTAPSRVAA